EPLSTPPDKRSGAADDPIGELLAPLSGVLKMASSASSTLIDKGSELLRDPGQAFAFAQQGGALAGEIAKLVLMTEDSATRFKGEPGVAKRVAWADPIPLDDVKAVGRALGCSVNDVLLS